MLSAASEKATVKLLFLVDPDPALQQSPPLRGLTEFEKLQREQWSFNDLVFYPPLQENSIEPPPTPSEGETTWQVCISLSSYLREP